LCTFGLTTFNLQPSTFNLPFIVSLPFNGVSMQPRELAGKIASGKAPAIIDVRTGFEFRAGHISGAIHAPIWKILLRMAALPADKQSKLVVLCGLGPRAMMGKIVLGSLGYRNVTLLAGHMAGWRRSGLPMEKKDEG
jgi:hydroxyacylglutathione hydrolase